jgi:hypothetical protein
MRQLFSPEWRNSFSASDEELAANESRYEIICDRGLHDGFCYGFDDQPLPSDVPSVPAGRVAMSLPSRCKNLRAAFFLHFS